MRSSVARRLWTSHQQHQKRLEIQAIQTSSGASALGYKGSASLAASCSVLRLLPRVWRRPLLFDYPTKRKKKEMRYPPIPEEESVPLTFLDAGEAGAVYWQYPCLCAPVSGELSQRGGTNRHHLPALYLLPRNLLIIQPNIARPSVGVASQATAQPRQRAFSSASRSGGSAYGYGSAA
ncbi:hypothetical protein HGRIS_001479 [Hohenbuehelia grisea]|uniref:Uncharacterized protein n=1 Tax=Hohenbuehelia grisea TaxID=104357 RepID=A0ABR3JQ11_9AGAR